MVLDIFADSDPNVKDEDLSSIKIDEKFARRFEYNKKREELQRYEELKRKGLVDSSSSDDSSHEAEAEDEDEDDDEDDLIRPEEELQFYDALLRVKKQDPIILQKDAKLFSSSSDENDQAKKRPKKERALYLKDVNYKHLTEEGAEFGENESKRGPKVYDSSQEENIKALLEAQEAAFGDDDGGDIIKEKESGSNEIEDDESVAKIQEKVDEYFEEAEENEDEMFLKRFLLNKLWMDKDKEKKPVFDDIGVSEDEDELKKQEKYETEYSFRHEEVEGDRILGHARFTEGSVRKKTSSRKVQRKSKEERMAQAELERKRELKHLKNLKKKEIKKKLEKFQAVAGIGGDGASKLVADDLEEDFDPEEYDKKMKEIFDDNYYGAEDADPGFASGDEGDIEKPDFDKEDELLGLPKDWDTCGSKDGFAAVREKVLKKKEEVKEEEEVEEMLLKEEGKRKRKRKMSLKEKVELEKELEEYYKLDYEDTIGDLNTRFKYKSVPANKYGLDSKEIWISDDKNLNQYVPLKRLAPYSEKEWEVTYHQKLKKDLILYGEKSDIRRNGTKHGRKADSSVAGTSKKQVEEDDKMNGEANNISRRKKRRHRQAELKLPLHRRIAYGQNSL